MREFTLSDAISRTLHDKRVEPVPRMCGGTGPRYVFHRYPIKGGISALDVMALNVAHDNALFTRLQARRGDG